MFKDKKECLWSQFVDHELKLNLLQINMVFVCSFAKNLNL